MLSTPSLVRHGEVGDWRLDGDAFLRGFRKPGAAEKHDVLAILNPLPRDARIHTE